MVHVQTLEKDYDASYKLDGTEHKIFDAVPKAICDLKQTFLDRVSAGEIEQLESDICQTGDCENCEHSGMPFLSCQVCDIFKCKSCKATAGLDIRGVLPF